MPLLLILAAQMHIYARASDLGNDAELDGLVASADSWSSCLGRSGVEFVSPVDGNSYTAGR